MSWDHVRTIGIMLLLGVVAHYSARVVWAWMQ